MKEKIKRFIQKVKNLWTSASTRRKVFYVAIVAIILLIILKGGKPSTNVVEVVKKQTITRTVIASGKVVSSTDLSLGFEASDVVRSVNISVGDKVKKGTVLATLSSGEERAALTSARGALLSADARYKKVLEGSSNEEIALAQVTLNNAKKDLENVIKVQNGLVENARRKLNSDGLAAQTNTSTTSIPTISGIYTGNEGLYKANIYSSGDGQYVSYEGLESGTAKASATIPQPLGTKGLSILFPSGNSQLTNFTIPIPNTTSSVYVANSNAYESAKDARDSAVSTAQSVVDSAEAQLNLKRATARQPDVDSALADVITAGAGVESAIARLEKKILRAPADGTITKVDIKVGEISTPQKEVVVLEDVANLYLEANIGEGNISTISLGQSVNVSYDAFTGQNYVALVSSIDPSATEDGNVINYKIKALISDVTNIRPGMTANMSIVTAEIPDVLVLPGRAVQKDDKGQFVNILIDPTSRKQKTNRIAVTTGVKGDGDVVEIKSGVSEGQSVLWAPPAK